MNSAGEWRALFESYAQEMGEPALRSLHVHLSGIAYGEKGERNHLTLEESDFDLGALLDVFKEFRCAGRILCESPAMEDDALVMKQHWADRCH